LGRHEEARIATQKAVRLNPSFARAQANLSLDSHPVRGLAQTPTSSLGIAVAAAASPQTSGDGTLAHYSLGLAFRQRGYLAEALREYELARERGEDRDLVTQAMAEVHLLRGDLDAAETLYGELAGSGSESPRIWNELGVVRHLRGAADQAIAAYRDALRFDPAYAIASNNMGVALAQSGDAASALEAFSSALASAPDFAKARRNLALLHHRQGRHTSALESYREALQASPEDPAVWNGIGLVLTALSRPGEARGAFARALKSRPDFAEAHYNLGFALSSLGDFAGALRAARRGMELDPFYVAPSFSLAIDAQHEDVDFAVAAELAADTRVEGAGNEFAVDEGALDSMFQELAGAELPAPEGGPASSLEAARQALDEGRMEDAAAGAGAALAAGESTIEALVLAGEAFSRQGFDGEALERYTEARIHDPERVDARLGEARALVRLGRAAEARATLEGLVTAGTDDTDVLLLAAEARSAALEHAGAVELLRAARAAAPSRADVLHQLGRALA